MNRISSENRKLNEILSHVVENYSVLQNQVLDLMIKSKKRKAGCDHCNSNWSGSAGSDQFCSCCSDDDSCFKRSRESSSKPKVMTVLVPTPISDSSLVCNFIKLKQMHSFKI